MDVIQEFGYICAVEELNKAIESFEPATESALDAIKSIGKRFWEFIQHVCRQIMQAFQNCIKKFKNTKYMSPESFDALTDIFNGDIAKLVNMSISTGKAVRAMFYQCTSHSIKEAAENAASNFADAKKIVSKINNDIERITPSKNTKAVKVNIEIFIDELQSNMTKIKKLEDVARDSATDLMNFKYNDAEDHENKHYIIKALNNAQSLYNTTVTCINKVITHISKL